MATTHQFILEPYKGMHTHFKCPHCQNKDKTFTHYIDIETGERLDSMVGRCSREIKCGYHYKPKQYFEDNNISSINTNYKSFKPPIIKRQIKPISYIPIDVFKASLKAYETNNFAKYLISIFGADVSSQLISRYLIGTSKNWKGATIFWQIDVTGKVRTGKIMLYNPITGKRVKEPYNHINWVHKVLNQPDFELKQCLFGEHLLKDKSTPVAIVESEKTAVIASVYLPNFIWLAFGGIGFNIDKCEVLKGREVFLFPDLNGFQKWSDKAKELSHIANFTVSDLLERKASEVEKEQGLDLADYLTRFDYREFVKPQKETTITSIQPLYDNPTVIKQEQAASPIEQKKTNTENWEKDILELEAYFSNIEIPIKEVMLNGYTKITDCSKFIESHLACLKRNINKIAFLPFLNRLQELKRHIMAQSGISQSKIFNFF